MKAEQWSPEAKEWGEGTDCKGTRELLVLMKCYLINVVTPCVCTTVIELYT